MIECSGAPYRCLSVLRDLAIHLIVLLLVEVEDPDMVEAGSHRDDRSLAAASDCEAEWDLILEIVKL